MAVRITSATVAALKPGEGVRDTEVRGFIARKGKDGLTTFEARRQGRDPVFKVLGRSDLLSAAQAREAARKLLAKHILGQAVEVGKSYTVRTAWPLWRAHLVRMNKSPRTISAYEDALRRLDSKIQNTPLRTLGANPELMADEHARIALRPASGGNAYRVKGHGAPAADSSARFVRALYRYIARRYDRTLPAGGPTVDIDLQVKAPVNHVKVMAADDLPAWWRSVAALENPIRSLCHLFSLLSGLRRNDLLTMRWENYGLDGAHTFRIPAPKGGSKRRFDLILSDAMETCLDRAQNLGLQLQFKPNYDVERLAWVWPGAGGSASGHLSGLESDVRRGVFVYLHGCRRTYASMAREAGVDEELLARLMNHRGGAGVTGHYIRSTAVGGLLRDAQNKISNHIIDSIGPSFKWPVV